MGRYIIRRLLQAIPLLFIISVILFVLSVKMGDPLATFGGRTVLKSEDRKRLTRQLGLDQPLYVQYVVWLVGNDWIAMDLNGDGKPDVGEDGKLIYGTRKGVLRGDLGTSFTTKQPVTEMIAERLPNTLLLMLTSEVVILIFSLVIGLISALKQYSIFDHTVTALSFIGYSMPIPLLALGLIYVFAVYFKRWGLPYFPTGGMFDPQAGPGWQQTLWHMVLPVTAISLISIAGYSRYVRANMLEVIGQDYIRTARAKGLAERSSRVRPRAQERCAAAGDDRGAGLAVPAGRRGRDRDHLCLAGHGAAVLRSHHALRLSGADGHHHDHLGGGGDISNPHRSDVYVFGSTHPVRLTWRSGE